MNFNNFSSIDWQHFIYSALLLIFLIIGLLGRRDITLKNVAKYLIIWSIVALFLIGVYGYRSEFKDFKDRFSSEINPSKAIPN